MTTPSPKKKKTIYIILLTVLAAIVLAVVLLSMWSQIKTRLSIGAAFGGAGFVNAPQLTHYEVYDIEPQIIYRLDDNRYVELSNYEGCKSTSQEEVAEVWYYDRNLGIKTEIPSAARNYQGRIINADPSGKNLIFPVSSDKSSCSDRGCDGSYVFYSTDYGRTLSLLNIGSTGTLNDPSEDSKEFTIVITEKELSKYSGREGDYSFVKIALDGKTIKGKPITSSYGNVKTIPIYPVVMDRYQCDANIKPKSVNLIKIKEYDEQHRPYVEQLLSAVNKTLSALDKIKSWQITLRTQYAAYNMAPQVIYRLDDNRYVELSNYGGCLPTYEDEKVVEVWYHDRSRNIKTRLFSKMRNYQGQVINADPSGKNLVFPVTADRTSCAEEKCGESVVYYSTDYGRTFKPFSHFISGDAPNPLTFSKEFTTVITDKELVVYVTHGNRYRFIKIALDKDHENEKPKDTRGYEKTIPSYPVVMDRYQCDASIKPKSVGGISVEEYNNQRKGN